MIHFATLIHGIYNTRIYVRDFSFLLLILIFLFSKYLVLFSIKSSFSRVYKDIGIGNVTPPSCGQD